MAIDLYYELGSPPCAAVYMTAKALNLDLNIINMDLFAGDQMKAEFLAINPQHCVPTIVDDGIAIWESRAIIIYLVEKYGDENTEYLYPKDVGKRALIHQRLFFDISTFYQKVWDYYLFPVFAKIDKKESDYTKLEQVTGLLNTFLEGNTYSAGETLTIADISLYASAMCLQACGFDLTKYENVNKWFALMHDVVPGADENKKAGEALKTFL